MGVVHSFIHRTLVTKKRILTYEFSTGLLLIVFGFGMPTVFGYGEEINFAILIVVLTSFVFLLFTYASIFVTARRSLHSRNKLGVREQQPSSSQSKGKRRLLKEVKLAKSCFQVTCTFVLCYLPSILLASPNRAFMSKYTFSVLYSWTMAFAMVNSSLNSIIFFWSKPMLRKEAKKVLNQCCSKYS